MTSRVLIVGLFASGVAMAAPPKSPDRFAGYAGMKLRDAPTKTKGFAKAWVTADTDNTSIRYTAKKHVAPAFLGVKVDDAVLTVSKHLKVIVGFSLKLSGDRCAAIEKTLGTSWGEPRVIGGMNREIEWPGKRVAASLEHQGLDCILSIGDGAWDDVKDDYKK